MSGEVIASRLDTSCPACGGHGLEGFYRQTGVPSHSCLLMSSEQEAQGFPRGDVELGLCRRCGFICNAVVDMSLQAYSSTYEETQGFSPRFQQFAHDLAQRVVEKYDVRGKDVLEIGCGKGEFLVDLCEIGGNRGVGVDPAIVEERVETSAEVRFIADYWSERYADLTGDLIVCRHTLEHVQPVGDFMRLLRRTIGDRLDTVVLFELPDVMRVLRETAFWDIYYEHCSYFTPGSLARLFRQTGFEVLDLALDYDDQYILIEAQPVVEGAGGGDPLPLEEEPQETARAVDDFRRDLAARLAGWRERLERERSGGRRTVLWGSGSKGVAFLNTLSIENEVEVVVDINPFKHGKYMAGTAQRIVAPDFLREYRPDLVIAMNPIYRDEIGRDLESMGVPAELTAV